MVQDLPDYHQYLVAVSLPPSPDVTNPKKYEGSVVTAGTPVLLSVYTDLGHNAGNGYVINDGPGDLEVDISNDGLAFETDITVKEDETISLEGLSVHTLRIDATEDDTEYRVLVV